MAKKFRLDFLVVEDHPNGRESLGMRLSSSSFVSRYEGLIRQNLGHDVEIEVNVIHTENPDAAEDKLAELKREYQNLPPDSVGYFLGLYIDHDFGQKGNDGVTLAHRLHSEEPNAPFAMFLVTGRKGDAIVGTDARLQELGFESYDQIGIVEVYTKQGTNPRDFWSSQLSFIEYRVRQVLDASYNDPHAGRSFAKPA